jgi:hypothetical protein
MTAEEKQFVAELLDLVMMQNEMIKDCNNVFHGVIMAMDKGHKELKAKVEKLKEGILKIKADSEEMMK